MHACTHARIDPSLNKHSTVVVEGPACDKAVGLLQPQGRVQLGTLKVFAEDTVSVLSTCMLLLTPIEPARGCYYRRFSNHKG